MWVSRQGGRQAGRKTNFRLGLEEIEGRDRETEVTIKIPS